MGSIHHITVKSLNEDLPQSSDQADGDLAMVLSAPTLKSPTTSRSTVPTVQASSATSSTQNLRQPYRRGSKGGFQTPAVDQDLALPDRVLEAILEHLAKEVVLETAPIVKHDNLHRPAVSRESSQTNAKTGSNQELLLRILSLSKTTKVCTSPIGANS